MELQFPIFIILFCCIHGNIYYPGFKRNFWLEFTSPRSEAAPSPAPAPAPVAPRPHFLHPSTNGSVMTVTLGQTTRVDCEVADLAGYQVSWLRRRGPEMSLLTTNQLVFSVDTRLGVTRQGDNWGLVIQSAQERDSASYLCQVNTHPPATLLVHLIVIVPSLTVVDDQGHPVVEKYFTPGTTILLRCLVTNYRPDFPAPVWRRPNTNIVIDSEKTRIKIDYGSDGSLESRLYVSGAGRGDAGRYSCVMPGLASVQPANINITVTQGEETAAIHSNTSPGLHQPPASATLLLLLLLASCSRHPQP